VCTGSSALPPDSPEECCTVDHPRRRFRLPAPFDLDGQLLFLLLDLLDEDHAFGRDAIDQRGQHLGRELDGVQSLDQLVLGELSLLTADRECYFEVHLRHAGRERHVGDRLQ